jgi:hypothetical protein
MKFDESGKYDRPPGVDRDVFSSAFSKFRGVAAMPRPFFVVDRVRADPREFN